MDPFTTDVVTKLTASLTAALLTGTGRRLGQVLSGSEKEQLRDQNNESR